jgi:hypothetical protein
VRRGLTRKSERQGPHPRGAPGTALVRSEQATYSGGQVRGTYLLDIDPQLAEWRDVPRDQLVVNPGDPPPELWDIPALWRGAHTWARANGFETAMPTFESAVQGGMLVYGLLLLKPGPWIQPLPIPVSTYERPTFAEPGFVMRHVNRAAVSQGYMAGWPTFVPDDPAWPPGRVNIYNSYAITAGVAQVSWMDVPAQTYLSLV